MENIQELVAVIREEFSRQTAALRAEFESFTQELRRSLNGAIERISSLERKMESAEAEILSMKRSWRKNNIIVSGLAVGEEIESAFIQNMKNLLNIDLPVHAINDIYRLSKNMNPSIKVEFSSYRYKSIVMKNKNKLKSTKIFINDDLCYEDRERLKLLKRHLHLAKSKHLNAYIKNGKLFINGKAVLPEDLINIPHDEILVNRSMEQSEVEKTKDASNTAAIVSRYEQLADKYKHVEAMEGGRLQGESTNLENLLQNTEDITRHLRSRLKPVTSGTGAITKTASRKKN